jgi:hypothetical protein
LAGGKWLNLKTERGSVTRSGLICRGDVLRLTEPRSEIKATPWRA